MLVTLILSPLLAMALTITYRVAAVDEDNLHVDYSRQGLTSLANVTWPEGVTSLHLGYNRLRTLTSWNSLDVTCLRRLDLSHNLLENVTNDSFRGMGQLQWLSLSDNQLKTLQVRPLSRTKTNGQRCCSYQTPVVWNNLPRDVRYSASCFSIKPCLKINLFKGNHFALLCIISRTVAA